MKTVGAVHDRLGQLKQRTLRSATSPRAVPGAPDGDYVICVFDTSFENQAAAVETVTVMRESGEWRIAGYFVR
jgi:hypothetical protein